MRRVEENALQKRCRLPEASGTQNAPSMLWTWKCMQLESIGLSQHRRPVGTRARHGCSESGCISCQDVAVPYPNSTQYHACEAAVSIASAGEYPFGLLSETRAFGSIRAAISNNVAIVCHSCDWRWSSAALGDTVSRHCWQAEESNVRRWARAMMSRQRNTTGTCRRRRRAHGCSTAERLKKRRLSSPWAANRVLGSSRWPSRQHLHSCLV